MIVIRQGLRDVNELKEVYKEKIQNFKKKASVEVPLSPTPPPISPTTSQSAFPPPPPPPVPQKLPGIKTLSSYLDVTKSRDLPPTELEAIWRLRHATNPLSLCATIPLPIYRVIEATAKKYPQFVLPLPKEIPEGEEGAGSSGAEVHILQWTFPAPDTVTVIFTHLAEFKLRGEYSQPHTTLTHHLELAEEKGIVLLQGHVMEGRGVSVDEAKWLVMCLQKFYGVGGEAEERRRLLEMFAKGDPEFTIEDLLLEAEKVV